MSKATPKVVWKIFYASSAQFRGRARKQLECEGYEEWQGSVNHEHVPPGIWEQYLLENIADVKPKQCRILGFKDAAEGEHS